MHTPDDFRGTSAAVQHNNERIKPNMATINYSLTRDSRRTGASVTVLDLSRGLRQHVDRTVRIEPLAVDDLDTIPTLLIREDEIRHCRRN